MGKCNGGYTLSCGGAGRLCGINRRTVDFYTNAGLLNPVMRSAGGHRFYDEGAVHRLRLIKALRAQGMRLDAIRAQPAGAEDMVDLLARVTRLQTEVRRVGEEVATLAPPLTQANARERGAIQATLAATASMALSVSQELLGLLSDLGAGPF
jgi:MerR family transcriptional regulator, copper efflux regulator